MGALFLQGIHDVRQSFADSAHTRSPERGSSRRHALVGEHLHALPLQLLLVVAGCRELPTAFSKTACPKVGAL